MTKRLIPARAQLIINRSNSGRPKTALSARSGAAIRAVSINVVLLEPGFPPLSDWRHGNIAVTAAEVVLLLSSSPNYEFVFQSKPAFSDSKKRPLIGTLEHIFDPVRVASRSRNLAGHNLEAS